MSDISVQQAGPGQTAVVARCVHALLDELSGGDAPPLAELAHTTQQVLGRADVTALIAFAGADPVGAIVLNDCAAIYAGGAFGEISELYVQPDWRSHGVAARLVAEAMALAKARGWRRLEVGAPSQPEWARSLQFYEQQGFDVVGPRLRRLV